MRRLFLLGCLLFSGASPDVAAFGRPRISTATNSRSLSDDFEYDDTPSDDVQYTKNKKNDRDDKTRRWRAPKVNTDDSWLDDFELETEYPSPAISSSEDDLFQESALDSLQSHPLLQVACNLSTDGKVQPVRTFCDTGAQRTVMSYECAEQAGLLQHLDRRYAGQAMGVGSCRVLGRIPAGIGSLEFDQHVFPSPAITVLESTGSAEVELLLGLDFLREYQAVLNLRNEELLLLLDQLEVRVPFIRPRQASTSRGGAASSSSSSSQASACDFDQHHQQQQVPDHDDWTDYESESDDCDIDMSGV